MGIPLSSGDQGASINLSAHADGSSDASRSNSGAISSGHTWVIPVGALLLLWLLGAVVFRKVRA